MNPLDYVDPEAPGREFAELHRSHGFGEKVDCAHCKMERRRQQDSEHRSYESLSPVERTLADAFHLWRHVWVRACLSDLAYPCRERTRAIEEALFALASLEDAGFTVEKAQAKAIDGPSITTVTTRTVVWDGERWVDKKSEQPQRRTNEEG